MRPSCGDDDSAETKKLLFMKAEVQFSRDIIKLLLAQRTTWEHGDFLEDPSSEEQQKRNHFYYSATNLLQRVEASYARVLHIDTNCFAAALESLNEVIQKYTAAWYASMGVGAAGGAFILSGGH